MSDERVEVQVLHRLSASDLQGLAAELGRLTGAQALAKVSLEQHLREIGRLTRSVAAHDAEIKRLTHVLETSWEMRAVACVRRLADDGTVRTYRLDTGEELLHERRAAGAVEDTAIQAQVPPPAVEDSPPVAGFERVWVTRAQWLAAAEHVLWQIMSGHHWKHEGAVYRTRSWDGLQLKTLLERARRAKLSPRVEEPRDDDAIADDTLDSKTTIATIDTVGRTLVGVILDVDDVERHALDTLASVATGVPWRMVGECFLADVRSSEMEPITRMVEVCEVTLHCRRAP